MNTKYVDWGHSAINDDKFRYMLRVQDTTGIGVFILHHNQMTSAGVKLLLSYKWNNLTSLSISSNNITDIGCKFISKISAQKLLYLIANDNRITSSGVLHLHKPQWNNLSKISLNNNRIDSNGGRWLVQADWKKLREINLSENEMMPAEVLTLMHNPSKMRIIEIYRNQVLEFKKHNKSILMAKFDNATIKIVVEE